MAHGYSTQCEAMAMYLSCCTAIYPSGRNTTYYRIKMTTYVPGRWSAVAHNRLIRIRTSQLPYVHGS